jgi:hypothetical protein
MMASVLRPSVNAPVGDTTPLFPQCTAYAGEPVGEWNRRFAPPDDCPKTARGLWEPKIEQPNYRIESEQARGEAEDGCLAIAVRGFQLQVFAAFLARRCDGQPWCVPRHHLLRLHRKSGRTEVLGARGPCTIMHVAPTDFTEVLPAAVAVPRAGD